MHNINSKSTLMESSYTFKMKYHDNVTFKKYASQNFDSKCRANCREKQGMTTQVAKNWGLENI